ncbi:hypothetical protein A8G00_21280 [Sphingobium sp. SA916]|nr:hypothetical protein A8G00_21280 [Sphingobium sp. SA916]
MADSRSRPPLPLSSCVSPASFVHVVIRTTQMDLMTEWYRTVLGTHVVFRNDIVCFLTYDGEHHRIALLNSSHQPADGGGNIDHIAYAYNDLGDLLGNYYRLKRLGIEPVRTINHGPTISFYYRDPENVMIELQVDNFATHEESNAFFHSEAFAQNPIGVLVEPDALRAAWEGGVSWEEIRQRPPLPMGAQPRDMQKERAVPRFAL